MPDLLVPHPKHGTNRHLPTGIDPVDPEDIGALVAPRIRFINETISDSKTYLPSRTGMRFIPLFIRAVATNPVGASTYEVEHRWLDESGTLIASAGTGNLGGTSSKTLNGSWAPNIDIPATSFGFTNPEVANNFLSWSELTTADNNKGIGSIVFTEVQNGNNGSTTVEMVLWEG